METKMIKANPTREFFVNMLVRDILLKQAIIELIDNSIDGARTIKKDNDFTGLKIAVDFDGDSFCIRDNCGGIPLDTTKTGIDESSLVYLQAKEKMIDIFKIVKGFIDEIRKNTKENDDGVAETVANMPSIELTTKNIEKVLPENRKLSIKDVKVKTVPNVVIRYKKPKEDVELLKRSLGVTSNNEVGELTFDYYKDAEC